MIIHSKSIAETRAAAEKLRELVRERSEKGAAGKTAGASAPTASAVVIGLSGDLGSGKTTFTQQFGALLGIEETIASPTFVLEKIYKITPDFVGVFEHLIHIDAYRIESEQEMKQLGWEEIISNPKNILMVEWPERIAGLMPAGHIQVKFEHGDDRDEGEHETVRIIEINHVSGKNT